METYGRQKIMSKTYYDLKNAFIINPCSERVLNNRGLESYLPKIKRWRLALGLLLFGILLITPFTPEFLIVPAIVSWVLK